MHYVSTKLVAEALAQIEGFPFERFVNDLMSALLGSDFVPLGGTRDGGADGILEDGKGRYIQASVREDVKNKIRKTVERLREFGRSPKQLVYVSSQEVRFPDVLEEDLTNELDVTIRIRDASYIESHINDSPSTIAAYMNHLQVFNLDLVRASREAVISQSPHVKDPSVFVFLSQEAAENKGSQSLMNDVVDSLILWALEGTDPDRSIFMSEDEVLEKILETLPSVDSLVRSRLPKRLNALSSKGSGGSRRVRAHRKEGLYCLPFETRQGLAIDIAEDSSIRREVAASIRNRIENAPQVDPPLDEMEIESTVQVSLRALQFSFERQGIAVMGALAPSLSSDEREAEASDGEPEQSPVYVTDHLAEALDEMRLDGAHRLRIADASLASLRGVLFDSTTSERIYLRKLSKTYTLLFTLSLDPRLINYFQQMTGHFYLYVGSDQIVRAMSEVYLSPSDQVVTNTLKLASQAGAQLVLTEPALMEAMHNLRTSDLEYKNTFGKVSDSAPYHVVRNSPKILVRAYMYAKMGLGSARPSNWQSFVNQFCDYGDLHAAAAFDSLRRYFQAEYGFEFRTSSELASLVDGEALQSLSESLVSKTDKLEVLADNDALMSLAVYGHRRKRHETSRISVFGYSTWWLTQESRILRHTRELINENNGAGYIMRPEFLLNFLTLAPSASEARDAFRDIFPSLLGVNLSRRMPEKSFRSLLDRITEAGEMSEARRAAKLSQMADKLKGDFVRTYLSTQDATGETTGIDAVSHRGVGTSAEGE
jgi:hypothetical protein